METKAFVTTEAEEMVECTFVGGVIVVGGVVVNAVVIVVYVVGRINRRIKH